MTMSRGCWLMLVWCSLALPCIRTGVYAQSVTITKVEPAVIDPVEGNVVELRCKATELMTGYIIEWTRMKAQEVSIARNGMSVDSRYTLDVMTDGAQTKVETLGFNATREDTTVIYGCQVRNSVLTNSTVLVETQPLTLTVRYFPSVMYPNCIPNGPFTVQEGATVNMSCTTEIGNPQVNMEILTSSVVYVWDYDRVIKEQIRSLQLSVTAANDGGSYQCKISPDSTGSSPFTGMERSCTIGPITVGQMTTENTPNSNTPIASDLSNNPTTVPPSTTPDPDETTAKPPDDTTTMVSPPTTSFPIAIIAGAAGGGGLLVVLLIIVLILYLCKCGCFKKDKQHPTLWQTNVPLTESNDHNEPWGKHSGSIGQDVEEMRELNPTPGFIQEPETEDALEMKEMETSAGGDVVYAQPRKKSTSKEQNKDEIGRPQGTDATGVDAEDAGAEVDETGGGESPPDGKVQKTKNKPQHKEERMSEDDHAELWQSYDPPGLIEHNYTEIPNMTAINPGLKPTALVKPVVHPTVSKPEDDLQSSPHSNDGVSPSVGDKPIIKKFQPMDRSVSQPQRGGFNPNRATSSAEQPQSTDDWSHPIEQHGHTPQDDPNEEARYAEVSHDHAQPHEATTPDDHHDITYAELDLNPPTSDAMPQPQEEQTLYASIVMD